VAQNQADGLVASVAPGDDVVDGRLIDVRSEQEFAGGSLQGSVNMPLPKLRASIDRFDKSEPIIVFCQVGQRGYVAARILMQLGFQKVYNLAGGYPGFGWRRRFGKSGDA